MWLPPYQKNILTWKQAIPPNIPFGELVQKVEEFPSIPNPVPKEDYKLGLCDPTTTRESGQSSINETSYCGRSLTSPKCLR